MQSFFENYVEIATAYFEKVFLAYEKDWSQQVEYNFMQVPTGTRPGVRKSERPLLACNICRECSRNSVKGQCR